MGGHANHVLPPCMLTTLCHRPSATTINFSSLWFSPSTCHTSPSASLINAQLCSNWCQHAPCAVCPACSLHYCAHHSPCAGSRPGLRSTATTCTALGEWSQCGTRQTVLAGAMIGAVWTSLRLVSIARASTPLRWCIQEAFKALTTLQSSVRTLTDDSAFSSSAAAAQPSTIHRDSCDFALVRLVDWLVDWLVD